MDNQSTIEKLNVWLDAMPKGASRCIKLSTLATVFLIAGWAKYLFFVPPGAFVSFGTSAIASLISFAVLVLGSVLPFLYGLGSIFIAERRLSALWVMLFAAIPLLSFYAIDFYLVEIKGIDFD